jgi:hypothetical protein
LVKPAVTEEHTTAPPNLIHQRIAAAKLRLLTGLDCLAKHLQRIKISDLPNCISYNMD